MGANAKCLHKCKLVQRKRGRTVKKSIRNRENLLHSPIAVNAQDFETLTTVWPAHSTRAALAAVHIRLDSAMIIGLDTVLIIVCANYRSGQLVSNHAWVCVSGVSSCKSVKIGSTYTYAVDAYQCAALLSGRRFYFTREESPWSRKHKLTH
jgi:hypothetical protein